MAPPPAVAALRSARVLVTGASGFIGRHLLARLRQAGAEVTAVSRRPRADEPRQERVVWVVADTSDAAAARALLEHHRPDVLFHLASIVSGSRDPDLVWPSLRANLDSTVALLLAVERRPCRFVQVGSLEEPPQNQPMAAPTSPYAAAKLAATGYCRLFAELYALEVAMARVFMVYGPGHQDENKLVPYVIRRLLAGEQPVLSSGARAIDWIYVDDVVEGLLLLATDRSAIGRQLDLGSGERVAVRAVVELIYRLLGRREPPTFGDLADRPLETVRVARVAETRAALGWRAAVPLEDGLRRTIDWFRAH